MRQEKYDVEKMSYISLGEKTLTPGEDGGKYMPGLLWRCSSLIDYYIMIIIPGGGWWTKVEGNPRGMEEYNVVIYQFFRSPS